VTGIAGLRIGHATDLAAKTGVTVFLADSPAIAAVHVAGGAPATRETDLLRPGNSVDRVDAIVLSGGSAFGLAAADGAMQFLASRGRGFAVGAVNVPIVPAACLFDLGNGGDKSALSPGDIASFYGALGLRACEAAEERTGVGSIGAGTGGTTADLKGGFGAAETTLADGVKVASFAAVNAVGRVTFGASPFFRAAPFEVGSEFGGLGLPSPLPPDSAEPMTKRRLDPKASTTLGVVATDCALTRDEAKRLAIAAHDGLALAIYPAHTPFDGDIVFALATARAFPGSQVNLPALCAAAAATLARAIARAIHAATPAPDDRLPTWRERYRAERHGV
jgi:L-aminopeptidase/D-esterase-like protein